MKTIETQAIITSISSKVDRSLGLRLSTPELSTEEKALFMELQGLNLDIKITPKDSAKVSEYKVNKDLETKTPSIRLRGVLYRVWQSEGSQGDFDEYYRVTMEKLINHFKEKLN